MMIVADLMTRSPATVLPETSLADAARIMIARKVSGLPVVDKAGHLSGIITEGDLLRRPELGTEGSQPSWLKTFLMPSALAADYARTHGRHVSEVMTKNPICVTPQTDLTEVTEKMRAKRIKRLPVLEGGALVGVISRSDLLRALALKLIETHGKPSDGTISEYILGELARERWAPQSGIRVNVTGNVVNLEGVIFSDNERQAVKVIAENAPGVKEVHDNLVYIDPGSGMAFPGG
jgi:CBS domain-containing protein